MDRTARTDNDGLVIEADQRRSELIAKELGVSESKGLATPEFDEPVEEDDAELKSWRLKMYRSLAARANYLALGRPDLQLAVNELCQSMARAT